MLVFTSVTKSYIPKARVLARSLKQHHPTWDFQLVLSDELPAHFDLREEPFDGVLSIKELGISDWRRWAFGHSIVELCTAVKGPAASVFMRRSGVDKIMYLDPDIKIFSSLAELEMALDEHDVLLTAHLLDPEVDDRAIRDNEISALKHGVFNLGFFAARNGGQGRDFVEWWSRRLLKYCMADIAKGLFTDQRWCDLAPCFFDRLFILRDRGYNAATWNLAHRRISRDSAGAYYAGDVALRFYHFTGYDSGAGERMLERYAADQPASRELWEDYASDLRSCNHGDPAYTDWAFGHFDNGEAIPSEARRVYRSRPDLQSAFPNPFATKGDSFLAWWTSQIGQATDGAAGSSGLICGLVRRLTSTICKHRPVLSAGQKRRDMA